LCAKKCAMQANSVFLGADDKGRAALDKKPPAEPLAGYQEP
jgi:hypothetical protein